MEELVEHLVIGTGFSGLAVAHALAQDGASDLVILDRAPDLGGVWLNNRYPGCSCDVPSYLYALEGMPPYRWSRRFPKREEILDYLRTCFRETGLDRHLRLNVAVQAITWLEAESRWSVKCDSGRQFKARFVYAATGQMPRTTIPNIDGLESFEGDRFHSSDWPEELDLSGKRVGVVGTGASGVQMVSGIAESAEHLTVFQRNAPYLFPRNDREFYGWERRLLNAGPFWRRLYRSFLYWKHEANGIAYFKFQSLLHLVRYNTMRQVKRFLPEGEVQTGATPSYAPGCKRVLVNDDYYPTFKKPHAELITDDIERIEGRDVVCRDGTRHPLDILVMATGFDGTRPMPGIDVVGKDGLSLHKHWDEHGVHAFYGTQVSGFPNLFLLIGPNVGLAHNSVLYMMESQVAFIRKIVRWAIETGKAAEIREEAQASFNTRLDRLLSSTPWQIGGCVSWFHDRKMRNVGMWPTYTFRFRSELEATSPKSQMDG
ncbi:MAG: NAD(P)/FAD-dependent oxidoreductase [Erythrobacter sp.]|nr:NAD(P)/FAD-dependent oxidoreductase [Erythrobacter sp.]